jgi:hypothetical protein
MMRGLAVLTFAACLLALIVYGMMTGWLVCC